MGVSVRIDDPALLPELASQLARNGCVAQPVDDGACRVVHVFAADAEEALQEVIFFVRAWQLAHPNVTVVCD